MQIFAKTDIGKERKINEDFFYISDMKDEIQLAILADGMGGYNAGEVASKTATQAVKEYIQKHFSKDDIEETIRQAIEYANRVVYDKAKKQKEALKKQKASNMELKEYRLSPVIDVGDFDTKVRNASKYLEKGHKVKLSIRFKGRQIAHPELAEEVLNKFASRVENFAVVEQKAKLEGRNMTMLLAPNTSK